MFKLSIQKCLVFLISVFIFTGISYADYLVDNPNFEWFDIENIGTKISLSDDDSQTVSLPFNFPFYGSNKHLVKIGSNGYLSFSSSANDYNNKSIPKNDNINDIIAPFWDDLNPSKQGTVAYYYDENNKRFIIQYSGIPIYYNSGSMTFQAILYSDGKILFRYKKVQGNLKSATVGIENSDGLQGIGLAYNSPYITDQMAVLISPQTDCSQKVEVDSEDNIRIPDGNTKLCIDTEIEAALEEGAVMENYNKQLQVYHDGKWLSLQVAEEEDLCYCEIDLEKNTHTCDSISAISFINGPNNNKAVVRINLNPDINNFKKALFIIEYGNTPTDWSLNIGDSITNNGWAGDGATQSNDAEMQIKGTALSIYGNDYVPPSETTDSHRHISTVENIVNKGSKLLLEVSDGRLSWNNNNGEVGELNSPYLYALNGQSDIEGQVNYDIYAGFNRVVSSISRSGSGITKIKIILSEN